MTLSVSAEAQQPVGSFDDLGSRVKSGNTVYVMDASARETTGTFVKVTDATLTILVDGQARDLPALDVQQIAKRGDSVKNGFLIGAAVGAAAGVALFRKASVADSDYRSVTIAWALQFGGLGALIDYIGKGRTVVYRAGTRAKVNVTPLVLGHDRGVRFSFSF